MMERAEVEQAIRDEETTLEEIARLLETRAPLAAWPEPLRCAFTLALDDRGIERAETWKVTVLQRHLFGPHGTSGQIALASCRPTAVDRRRSEHLRAALAARVGYRAGVYLLG